MTTLLLLALYFLSVVLVGAAAAWLRCPIPRPILIAFALVPVLMMLPAFTSGRTPVPVDHSLSIPPWNAVQPGGRLHNEYMNDVAMQILPWSHAVRLAWRDRSLPLRNRWNGCGMVLAANSQSSAFFPLSLFASVLPLPGSFALLAALKVFLALCGTWLWLRSLRVSPGSSAFGAVAFSLSLTMTPWLLFPASSVACLWPWALFAIELMRREDGRPGFFLATAVFVLWALGGHPESAASGAAFAALLVAARWLLRDIPDAPRMARRLAAAAALSLGLSAFLLLPQVLAILASNRIAYWGVFWARHLTAVPHGPLWLHGLITPFFPRLLGDAVDSPMLDGHIASYPEMGLAYFGIVGWACALFLLRRGARRPAAEWAVCVPLVIGWAHAIGLWPFTEIVSMVPALKLMFPIRFLSWVALAGAALAAFELDRWIEDLRAGRLSARWAAAISAASLGLLGWAAFRNFRGAHAASGGLASQREWLILSLAALGAFAAAGLLGKRRAFRLALSLTLVNGAELYIQGQRLYRFGSPDRLFPPTPVIRWLATQPKPFRVLGQGATFFPNSNVHAGVEEIRTHDAMERRDYVEFLDAMGGYPPAEYFKHLGDPDAPALDFLNVRYFVGPPGLEPPGKRWRKAYAGEDATAYENATVLPRVFLPESIRLVPPGKASSNFMRLFSGVVKELAALEDWRTVAYLAANPRAAPAWREGPQRTNIVMSDYREKTNTASFRIRNPSPGPVAIVASLAHDGGWSASTDSGLSLPVTHANGPFLAIAVPPGEYRVRLRYASPGFAAGAAVSAASVLLLAALFLWRKRRQALPARTS